MNIRLIINNRKNELKAITLPGLLGNSLERIVRDATFLFQKYSNRLQKEPARNYGLHQSFAHLKSGGIYHKKAY